MIYSGDAMYKLLKSRPLKKRLYADPFKDRHSKGEDFPVWKGTVVGIDISLDNEALRVVRNMPKWKPGRQGGRAVKVRYTVPILFDLQ